MYVYQLQESNKYFRTGSTDRISTNIEFWVDSGSGYSTLQMADYDIIITNHGSIKQKFDIESWQFEPSDLSMTLYDGDGLILSYIETGLDTIMVEILINGSEIFTGKAILRDIQYDVGNKILSFRAMPETDVLSNTSVYGENGENLDPFTYNSGLGSPVTDSIIDAEYDTVKRKVKIEISVLPLLPLLVVGDTIRIINVVGMTDINGYHLVSEIDAGSHYIYIDVETPQYYESGGLVVRVEDINATRLFSDIFDDCYQLIDSGISVEIKNALRWIDYDGTPRAITNAVSSGARVIVTHDSYTSYTTGQLVYIQLVEGMTSLNGTWTIEYINDTSFYVDLNTTETYTSGGVVSKATIVDVGLTGISISDVDLLFTDSDTGITSVSSLLNIIAKSLFSYTGALSNSRAFFKNAFYYDSTDLQTVSPLHHEITYPIEKINYAEFTTATWQNPTLTGKQGDYTHNSNNSMIEETPLMCWLDARAFAPLSTASAFVYGGQGLYQVNFEDYNDTWYNMHEFLAEIFYYWRSQNLRVDEFTCRGIDYDFIKNFNYDGGKYWIIEMNKDFGKYETEIKAVYLGAL